MLARYGAGPEYPFVDRYMYMYIRIYIYICMHLELNIHIFEDIRLSMS
jgi:hypothetical protein